MTDFQTLLAAQGYHLTPTARGAKLNAILHTPYATHATTDATLLSQLQDEALLRLLSHAQLRKERPFSYSEMMQLARPEHPGDFQNRLLALVKRRLLRRGYTVRCSFCQLQHWYAWHEVTADTVCAGCQRGLLLPLDADFTYRANPLLADTLRNGGLTTWLTLAYLQQQYSITRYLFCADVRGHGINTDIDLLATTDDEQLLLVECKDRLPAASELTAQLRTLAGLAHDIGADVYLATLHRASDEPSRPAGVRYLSREMLLNPAGR